MGLLTDLLKEIPHSAVLKEKITQIEFENETLKADLASTRDDLREARATVVRLEKELQRFTHKEVLSNEKNLILSFLAKHNFLSELEFPSLAKMDQLDFDFHVHELRNDGFVEFRKTTYTRPGSYLLTQKGREYAIKNNLK